MSTKIVSNRRYEFDWLRVTATLAVFLFHSSRFFNQRDWMVKNLNTYAWVDIWCTFAMNWLMPLFFMISGVSLFYAVSKFASWREFLASKFLRLMIPVLVASVTHSALQVYLERLSHGLFHGSFFAFIPHYFDGVYEGIGKQGGNFCPVGMHLWYLLFLYLDGLIFYHLFVWFKGRGSLLLNRITSLLAAPGLIYICFPLPQIIMYAAMPPAVMTIGAGDWGFFYYLWFFLAGFMLISNKDLEQRIETQRWMSLTLAVLCSTIYLYQGLDPSQMILAAPKEYWQMAVLYMFSAWFWLFAILGFTMHGLTVDHPVLGHANQAVLPFYILHQSVLVAIGYFIMDWQIHDFLKWILVFCSSFIVIISIYLFLIKKFDPIRFLFGLKTAHPFYQVFQKRSALMAAHGIYLGLIFFAAAKIAVDHSPMPLSYDSNRDIVLNARSITEQSSSGVNVVKDNKTSCGKAIEFSSGANERIEPRPEVFVEMAFNAPAGRYFIWLRGKSDLNPYTDSIWLQADEHIGTSMGNLRMGNWLDIHPAGLYGWAGDSDRSIAIEFKHGGKHKIRLQPRQTPHRIDQIWLSRGQLKIPNTSRAVDY